jgi:hypothetical protein
MKEKLAQNNSRTSVLLSYHQSLHDEFDRLEGLVSLQIKVDVRLLIVVLLFQVTYDQWGDPTPWAADWEMAKSVEDVYGCITPPVDMYQLRQAELWMKMEHHSNPDCVPMTDVLQRALLDAEHSRLKQFTEATETYECDVRDGRQRSTSPPLLNGAMTVIFRLSNILLKALNAIRIVRPLIGRGNIMHN